MSNITLCCGHKVEDMSETVTVETLENGSRVVGVYCEDCAIDLIKSGEATHVSYHVNNYPEDWQHTTNVYDMDDNPVCEVKITWIDAKSYNGQWLSMEDVKQLQPEKAITKGFIVHEDNDCYYIAQTVGESGMYNIFLLPKGCMKNIKRETNDNRYTIGR